MPDIFSQLFYSIISMSYLAVFNHFSQSFVSYNVCFLFITNVFWFFLYVPSLRCIWKLHCAFWFPFYNKWTSFLFKTCIRLTIFLLYVYVFYNRHRRFHMFSIIETLSLDPLLHFSATTFSGHIRCLAFTIFWLTPRFSRKLKAPTVTSPSSLARTRHIASLVNLLMTA